MKQLATFALISLLATSRVLAAVATQGDFRIDSAGAEPLAGKKLDEAVTAWMAENDIHAAQLAVRQSGKLIFSHAYTMGAGYPTVTRQNTFRLASISKMLVTAAFSKLLTEGKLTGGERVYPYLGITMPLLQGQVPDKRAKDIIALELAEHTSGLPGEGAGDPLFAMRDIEVSRGAEPLTETQFAQYLYGLKLLSNPGFTALYSNVGYALLAMVIEKAAGEPYATYVQDKILSPLHMTNWTLSPTRKKDADPNEVFANDPYTGPSIFNITPQAPQRPFDFEGGDIIWEIAQGPSDYVTNAESVSKFIFTWNVYGLGGRAIDYARDGCMPGASTWAESETPDIDFALLFNAQPCLDFSSSVISQIRTILATM